MSDAPLLSRIADLAREFLDTLPHRPVGARADLAALRSAFGGALPASGGEPGRGDRRVLEQRLFRDVASEIDALAEWWLPRLRDFAESTKSPEPGP